MSICEEVGAFRVSGGLRLVQRSWSAPDPCRAIAIVHGLAEHSERYGWVGRSLASRGYWVGCYDQRGHGESEGVRNDTPSFDTLLDDLTTFLGIVRREQPELPLIVLGHSMGGLEVAGLLALRDPDVTAAVLSGPALRAGSGSSRALRWTLAGLARVLPRLRLRAGIDPSGLCRDPAVVEAYRADPRIDPRVTLRLARELIKAADAVCGGAASVRVPLLVLHGEADPLCDVRASRDFFGKLETRGCELRTYPGLLHEILNEPEREIVLQDICGWLDKRIGSGRLP